MLVLRTELQGYRESLVDLETHIRVVQMNLNEVSQLGFIDSGEQDEEFRWHGSLESSRTQLRQLQEQWCARLQDTSHTLRNAESPADQEDLQESFLQALQRELNEQEKQREQLARQPGNHRTEKRFCGYSMNYPYCSATAMRLSRSCKRLSLPS